jgi:indole-3-glycerol phosphate synthase
MLQRASDYRAPEAIRGTILEKIMHVKVHELIGAMEKFPALSVQNVIEHAPEVRPFKKSLIRRSPAVIAEIKKASPSSGVIREDFDPLAIAREYEDSGAAALSVLTEVQHFQGGLEILAQLRWYSKLPLLRKDFIIDPYQVLEARHAGADAVLLIAALLDKDLLKSLRVEAESLGMEALVEVHDEAELKKALDSGATLIGVNNRDLRTFEVSLEVSVALARMLPKEVLAVSESGIRAADDIKRLSDAGYRAFLVGEPLIRAASPGDALSKLLSARIPARRSAP